MEVADYHLPASDGARMAWLYEHGEVMERRDEEDGVHIDRPHALCRPGTVRARRVSAAWDLAEVVQLGPRRRPRRDHAKVPQPGYPATFRRKPGRLTS